MDYLPFNTHHRSLSSFFPLYQSSLPFLPQSTTFYGGYTPNYYFRMPNFDSGYSPSVSYHGPVEYVDEIAIIFDSEDMFRPQTHTGRGPVEYVDEMATILDSEDMFHPQTQMGPVNSGLSERAISKNLKTSRYQVDCKAEEGEGEVCAVCQDEYKVKEMVGTLQCGHGYHAKCIKKWLLLKNHCPVCRATVSVV